MSRLSRTDRVLRITAIVFAALALAAPASMARALQDATVFERPVAAVSLSTLTEEQILASRGQGAPSAPISAADPLASGGVDGGAPTVWLIGIAVVALMALAAWTLTTRRRARATA
jgi:hypothetical protein